MFVVYISKLYRKVIWFVRAIKNMLTGVVFNCAVQLLSKRGACLVNFAVFLGEVGISSHEVQNVIVFCTIRVQNRPFLKLPKFFTAVIPFLSAFNIFAYMQIKNALWGHHVRPSICPYVRSRQSLKCLEPNLEGSCMVPALYRLFP